MKPKAQKNSNDLWFEETVDENEKRVYKIANRIFSGKSKFQSIEILNLANQGVTLVLDGFARVFEVDEFLFHEALIHPAMHLHNKAESILLIGDGDGGGIRELIKYKEVNKVDWVEIDEMVVNACKTYLPSFPQALSQENRVKTFFVDGQNFLQENKDNKYDCIFLSVTEEIEGNVSQPFYSQSILNFIKQMLKPGGYCVQSSGVTSPGLCKSYKKVFNNHKIVFPHVSSYSVGLPSFGLSWGFCLSGNQPLSYWRQKEITKTLRFYDESVHQLMFLLPNYMQQEFSFFEEKS